MGQCKDLQAAQASLACAQTRMCARVQGSVESKPGYKLPFIEEERSVMTLLLSICVLDECFVLAARFFFFFFFFPHRIDGTTVHGSMVTM